MKRIKSWCLLILSLLASTSTWADQKIFIDEIFNDKVGVVQLHSTNGQTYRELDPPIVHVAQQRSLMLQFDILQEEYDVLSARIIHCNADWTQSILNDIEFIAQYNAFDITTFDYSSNSKVLYVNYQFRLPQIKRSGNYVIQVYENNNPSLVLFQRRFVLYESLVEIAPTVRVSNSARLRRTAHQIDFDLLYGGLGRADNPLSNIKVVLRQNNRWDNTIANLKPTNYQLGDSRLEYRHFDGSNNFLAGNEFRFFDLRTLSVRGMYVASIDRVAYPIKAEVATGDDRGHAVYTRNPDRNGNFQINTIEMAARYLEADYVQVTFRLKSPPVAQAVYVVGAFNYWQKNDKSMMMYDAQSNTYFRTLLLKQGIYDYQFECDGEQPLLFENSFIDTRNDYDIIIYYRSNTEQADRVVGYKPFESTL